MVHSSADGQTDSRLGDYSGVLSWFTLANKLTRIGSNSLGALQKALVLSEVLNELSTITLFVEREWGDVEFDSIRVIILISVTQAKR